MKPYSREFRGQVLAACDRGRSTREVATYFDVSESWVRRVKKERREFNKIAPCLKRRRTPLWAAGPDTAGTQSGAADGPFRSDAVYCAAQASSDHQKKSSTPRRGNARTLRRDGKSCVGSSRI